MILRIYSCIFTEDLDATLRLLQPLIGRGPELRVGLYAHADLSQSLLATVSTKKVQPTGDLEPAC